MSIVYFRNSKFTVSSNFIVVSACFSLSINFRKPISGCRIDDECDALFFNAIFGKCAVGVIIQISVYFVFL